MTLDEAFEELEIKRNEAKREIGKHNCSWEEFVSEVGDKQIYSGAEILEWLGY